MIAGSTSEGHVAMWKFNGGNLDGTLWELQPPSKVGESVESVKVNLNEVFEDWESYLKFYCMFFKDYRYLISLT